MAIISVNTDTPDPTDAINVFLLNMVRARELGFVPRTEHALAEHLFRQDVKVMFYSSASGIVSLVSNDDWDEDAFETVQFLMERRIASRRRKRSDLTRDAIAEDFGISPTKGTPHER